MRCGSLVLAAMLVTCAAGAADAQSASAPSRRSRSPSPARRRRPSTTRRRTRSRIVGSQDSDAARPVRRSRSAGRSAAAPPPACSSDSSSSSAARSRLGGKSAPRGAETLGWLRVVAVNDSTRDRPGRSRLRRRSSVGRLPRAVRRRRTSSAGDRPGTRRPGQPDFTTLGHIVAGNEDRDHGRRRRFRADRLGPEPGPDAGRALRDLSATSASTGAAARQRRRRRGDLDRPARWR